MTNTKRFILPISIAFLGLAALLLSVTTQQSLAANHLDDLNPNERYVSAVTLVNGDFETGDASGWTSHGSGGFSADSGSNAYALWGQFNGAENWSGILQTFSAAEGDTFCMDSQSYNRSADPMAGDNRMVMKIVFKDAGNNEVGSQEVDILTAASATDTWLDHDAIEATAPANTASVEAHILFGQDAANTAGAGHVDNITFEQAACPGYIAVIEDYENGGVEAHNGDPSDWEVFGDGGGGINTGDPYEGAHDFQTGWGGSAGTSFGGFWKDFANDAQIAPPANAEFSIWVYNKRSSTSDGYTLEITLREDIDGNGYTEGSYDDEVVYDHVFTSDGYNNSWVEVRAPLTDFVDNNATFGNGVFDGHLDQIVIGITDSQGNGGVNVEADFDYIIFEGDGPAVPLTPTLLVGFSDAIYNVVEGSSAEITVSLSITSTDPVTVTVNSIDRAAAAGSDYTAIDNHQIVIPAGELARTLTLDTIDNTAYELPEDLELALTNNDGVPFSRRTTSVIISDDDAPDPSVKSQIVDDFTANSLPFAEITEDGNTYGIGFVVWKGPGATSVAIETTTTADASIDPVPNADGTNEVLKLTSNVADWGGVTHAFENDAVDAWVSQDWSEYAGFCFWYYGTGTGTQVLFEINENRAPFDAGDPNANRGAEVWSYTHNDSVAGWQFVQIPFTALARKNINNGAPNDGWTGEAVHGWSIGSVQTADGEEVRYIDDFGLWGTAPIPPLSVNFGEIEYEVTEGDTLAVEITLNRVYTEGNVTVEYRTDESYATPDRDFVSVGGSVVIPSGTQSVTVDLVTIDDTKFEGTEALQLSLVSADNAELGFAKRTIVKIVNNDAEDTALLHDFEGWHPFEVGADLQATIVEVMTGTAQAIPGQGTYEQVLSVSPSPQARAVGASEMRTTFVEPQDWTTGITTSTSGISFWYYGNGSGEELKFEVMENASASTATLDPAQWVDVWSQEFDDAAGTLPDSNVWSYELGDGLLNDLHGWGNDELQHYTNSADNASMDGNGNLVITLQEMTNSGLHCHYGECTQSSARLISENKKVFKYGEIEAKIKVPDGPAGLWPAFWMLGTDIREVGWPNSGEIDIMEYVSKAPSSIFGTVHGPGHFGGNSHGSGNLNLGAPVSDDYHTFKVVWSPNKIEWHVDGNKYFEATPDTLAAFCTANGLTGCEWAYNHPFYVILNFAIGGNFGGAVDAGMTYPQEMLVDYIRVKGAPDSAERWEASFVDNTIGWKEYTIPFSAFSRSDAQQPGAPNDGFSLTEVNGYGVIVPQSNPPASRVAATNSSFMMDEIRIVTNVADDEYDGVDNETENGAPNNGDGNGDGILDSEQTGVSSLPNAADGNYVTVDADANSLHNVSASNPVTLPQAVGNLPYGALNFALDTTVGGSEIVTLTLHGADPDLIETVWKQASDGSWFQFMYSDTVGTGAVISGTTVILHLTDGAWGDIDGVANGRIVDPVAPGLAMRRMYFPVILNSAQMGRVPTTPNAAVAPLVAPTVYRDDASIEQTNGDN